ncbi:MAG: YihY/virulence factor BrkB family protein [Fidelibacterota bacterium]
MKNIQQKIENFINYIRKDIWLESLKAVPRTQAIVIKSLRVQVLAIKGFIVDKCILRASALTFFTLLSIVPLVAMFFAIAKGFDLQQIVENEVMERFSENEQIVRYIIDFSNSLLTNTKGSFIAGPGFILLIWAVIRLLSNIEMGFNDIWNINQSRSFVRKFSDYISIMLVAPLLIILSNGLSIYIFSRVTEIADSLRLLGFIGPVLKFLLRLSPFAVMWMLLTFVYIVIPNGKVNFAAGFYAAIVAGTFLKIFQWGFITFQIGAAKYNAIYGSFAALPLFLIWLQISWIIVLFGAEVSYAIQNAADYTVDEIGSEISQFSKKVLSLLIALKVVQNFEKDDPPLTANQLAQYLGTPVGLINQYAYELKNAGIISHVLLEDEEVAFQPAVDPDKLTVAYVVRALENTGSDKFHIKKTKELEKLKEILTNFQENNSTQTDNILLQDLKIHE